LQTEKWLNPNISIFFPSASEHVPAKKKCPDVPTLTSYSLPPDPKFWEIFPAAPLPKKPVSPVIAASIQNISKDLSQFMTQSQSVRAATVVSELTNGSAAPLLLDLPPIRVQNAKSVLNFGEEFTDTLAHWIRKGYVAGPFSAPPDPNFRENSMMALEQKDKVRVIMNLSSPKGTSFNDAIDELALEKVSMSTARKFGYSVIDCGVNARMWKWDLVDAYKNIPVPIYQLKYQGFRWLGKTFTETQKVFGDKSSVAGFDRLGHTCVDFACIISNTPSHLIHRTLDDTPLVTPADSEIGPRFAEAYERTCAECNVKLAPPCPKNEKTFSDCTKGSVLGILFDTTTLTWSVTYEKASRVLLRIRDPLLGGSLSLLETQQLLGSLNDVGQMCTFLRGFRHPLQTFLTEFGEDDVSRRRLPPQAVADLRIWAAAILDTVAGLPIPHRPSFPSLNAMVFVSDAAGALFSRQGDRFIPYCTDKYRGAVSLGMDNSENIWFCARLTWPMHFLLQARDTKDHAYGCKSSTLEAIGAMLPFLCCPSTIAGNEIILLTDNEAIIHGWDSRKVKNDVSASIILRAIHIISFYLGCSVELRHLPRMSNDMAKLADRLTRSSTTGRPQLAAIADTSSLPVPHQLLDWLRNPTEDWTLPIRLLSYVKSIYVA
jgi:hypothetical protein